MLQKFVDIGLKIRAFALKFGYLISLLKWLSECFKTFPIPKDSDDELMTQVEEEVEKELEKQNES